jgi:hypothetical protein
MDPALRAVPFATLSLADGHSLLVKVLTSQDSYVVLATDFMQCYSETLLEPDLLARAKVGHCYGGLAVTF